MSLACFTQRCSGLAPVQITPVFVELSDALLDILADVVYLDTQFGAIVASRIEHFLFTPLIFLAFSPPASVVAFDFYAIDALGCLLCLSSVLHVIRSLDGLLRIARHLRRVPGLIRELLDRPGDKVVLFPRPRRFGKTLNMSMLRYFFEKSEEDRSPQFQDLSSWQAGEEYRVHFQRYPVIFLTLKDIARDGWQETFIARRVRMQELYRSHRTLLASPHLEAVYHIFTLELLAVMEGTAGRIGSGGLPEAGYKVRSNRESGSGRPDVLVIPRQPDAPGGARVQAGGGGRGSCEGPRGWHRSAEEPGLCGGAADGGCHAHPWVRGGL